MALTNVVSKTDTVGRYLKVKVGTITFDSSYPTGGESLVAADLGFSTEISFLSAAPSYGLIYEYDATNKKLLAHYPTGGADVPATRIAPNATIATGATTVTGASATPNIVEVAGISAEVANTTDISTVVTQYVAFGF